MKEEFQSNYDAYNGDPWKLASGVVVDEVIAAHAKTLLYESTLHSFIIEDVNTVLHLFPEKADKDELIKALVERPGEKMTKLSKNEQDYLNLYNKSPNEVDQLLAGGWANLTGPKKRTILGDEFPRIERLIHQPGEITSQSSGLRKNEGRTLSEKQLPGRKTDGLIISADMRLEICTIEAAKKNNGASSTKALMDIRKMAKNMKDMNDIVCSKIAALRSQRPTTYGIRISGCEITFYTLRQRPGRLYQLCIESTVSFPATWFRNNTTMIILVLASLLAFRKELSQAVEQITEATNVPIETLLPADNDHFWPATLTTPPGSPRLSSQDL
ncbi:hypothetical protein BGW38_003022 [Lunasporangiospora selenospora]|uniref:Uncharacterized protein n=1 Tax=Lunasporangiospora selenospora TaxID=979761 RepID=A0A9P6FRY8_9FUNG|nr:hypothetical protein BGW38_003022 [Lunasporangiospora selenospora]